jgi:anti-sigma B factor antagonist
MALDIKINFDEEKKTWIVQPEGEVDIYNSPKFKEVLVEALKDEEGDILIKGDKLEYLDSTGLGVLISILKKTREKNHDIIITNIKPSIKKLFDITGLEKVFIIKE